jgi:hypothetical protein
VVFIASNHPVWRVVRRSLQLLTGAAMLTAILGSGPASPAAVVEPPATVSIAVNIAPEKLESTAIHAEPVDETVHVARAEQQAPLPLTSISVLSGRISAAALGERAPPRL